MKYNYRWREAFKLANNGNRFLLDEHIAKAYAELVIPIIRLKYRGEVDDLANDVMSKFWERFFVLEVALPENVNGYIYTMTVNRVFKANRMDSKLVAQKVDLDEIDFKKMLESKGLDNRHILQENEDKHESISAAIRRLCDTCRKIIQYSFFEKRKLKDCYEDLNLPTANAASKKKVKCLNKLIKYSYEELKAIKNINKIENRYHYA